MQNKIIMQATENQINTNLPQIRSGDFVSVIFVISSEKGKERTQNFEGTIICIKGEGASRNVTVRKGVKEKGVEKTFPLNSPLLKKLEVISHGKVRKARPFYLRNLSAKALRNKLRPTNTKSN